MISLAVAALLSVQDPVGDTSGNGSLLPPTAAVYRTLGSFDVTGLEVMDSDTLSLRISFAALSNPFELPNGFSLPIIELYIEDETQGRSELPAGSGLALPAGSTWHYGFKLNGDETEAFVADGGTVIALSQRQVEVRTENSSLLIETSLPRPETFKVYGAVGNYSPFTESGWQPLSATPSPWSFSSTSQNTPVVDVIAETTDAQVRALETGVLPALAGSSAAPQPTRSWNLWLFTMVGGALLGLTGLAVRFRTTTPPSAPVSQPRGEVILPTKRINDEVETENKSEAVPEPRTVEDAGDTRLDPQEPVSVEKNPVEDRGSSSTETREKHLENELPSAFEEDWFDLENEDALEAWEDASPSETGDDVYTPDVKPS